MHRQNMSIFRFFNFMQFLIKNTGRKSLGRVKEIDLSAHLDTDINFVAPRVFELG